MRPLFKMEHGPWMLAVVWYPYPHPWNSDEWRWMSRSRQTYLFPSTVWRMFHLFNILVSVSYPTRR